jgi:PIN domain nuclease of toxin-antitoxin system
VVTYLLDTAPFLWAVARPEMLSPKVRKLMDSRKNPLFVSAASLWEIIIKAQKGLLPLEGPPRWLDAGLASIEAGVLPIKPTCTGWPNYRRSTRIHSIVCSSPRQRARGGF